MPLRTKKSYVFYLVIRKGAAINGRRGISTTTEIRRLLIVSHGGCAYWPIATRLNRGRKKNGRMRRAAALQKKLRKRSSTWAKSFLIRESRKFIRSLIDVSASPGDSMARLQKSPFPQLVTEIAI